MKTDNSPPLSPGVKTLLDGLSIRTWAKKNAQKLLEDSRFSGKKVYLKDILKFRRIHKVLFDPNQKSKGMLMVKEGGFAISLASRYKYSSYLEEKRFTVAHEIGHTYFYDVQEDIPKRYPWLGSFSQAEEIICDTFASELLMPEDLIINDYLKKSQEISSSHLFIDQLIELSVQYSVTKYVMGLRLIRELELWNGILLCCSIIGKHIGNIRDDPALRVLWAIFPRKLDGTVFFHRPTSNRGPFMKLRWQSAEEKYNKLISFKSDTLLLSSTEFYKLSNIKKIVPLAAARDCFEVGVMKIDRYPLAIPLENVQTNLYGLHQVLLISIPLDFDENVTV